MKKIVILFIVLFSAHFSFAQEKYSYMQVSYDTYDECLNISDGAEYKVEKLEKRTSDFNANPLLRKISELEDQGWELTNREMVSMSAHGGTMTSVQPRFLMIAYLRKKK